MSGSDAKDDLHRYLRMGREALLWKLDGLSEYDVRRPLVPTGTNLLGLVKHCAGVECGYYGQVMDRPFPGEDDLDWRDGDDDELGGDMYATAAESRERVTDFYRRVLAALARVEYGETTTYGTLAARAGNPRGARAVGTVMNRNPVPIVLPCHRVVGANGSLTGYGGGLWRKELLLQLETGNAARLPLGH